MNRFCIRMCCYMSFVLCPPWAVKDELLSKALSNDLNLNCTSWRLCYVQNAAFQEQLFPQSFAMRRKRSVFICLLSLPGWFETCEWALTSLCWNLPEEPWKRSLVNVLGAVGVWVRWVRTWADGWLPPAAQTGHFWPLKESFMDLNMDPLCQVTSSRLPILGFSPLNCRCQTWEFRHAFITRQLLLMRTSGRFMLLLRQPVLPLSCCGFQRWMSD